MVTVNLGGCCCPGSSGSGSGSGTGVDPYNCTGGYLIPSSFVVEFAGFVTCISSGTCQGDIINIAPIENGIYTLTRSFTSESGECGATDDCTACYTDGSLTACDIAAIHGTTIDVPSCGGDDNCVNDPCRNNFLWRNYKYVKTTVCDDITIDSYISVQFCFSASSGVGTIFLHWIHVSTGGGGIVMHLGRGVWNALITAINTDSIDPCVPPAGSYPGCELGASSATGATGFGNLTLGPAPSYTGSLTTTCCGDFTVTVNAG